MARVLTQWVFVTNDSFPPNAAWLFRVGLLVNLAVLVVLWFLKMSEKAKIWTYLVALTVIGPWTILLRTLDLVLREFGWGGFWNMQRVLGTAWASAAAVTILAVLLLERSLRKKAELRIDKARARRPVL